MAKNDINKPAETSADMETLLQNLKAKEVETKGLYDQINSLKETIKELQSNNETLNEEITSIKDMNTNLSQSNDALSEQLKNLQNDNSELAAQAKSSTDEQLQSLNEQLENLRKENQDNYTSANKTQLALDEAEKTIEQLKEQLDRAEKKTAGIRLSPFATKVLNELSKRLTKKYSKEISVRLIIEDYVVRYNLQRRTEWFHPFVLSKDDLVKIAQTISPKITSFDILLKAVKLQDESLNHHEEGPNDEV